MRFFVISLILLSQAFSNLFAQQQLSTKSKKAIKLYQDGLAKANLLYFDQAIKSLKEAIEDDKKFI